MTGKARQLRRIRTQGGTSLSAEKGVVLVPNH